MDSKNDFVLPSSSTSLSFSQEVIGTSESCKVCGKPAAGLHYNVQTCHGCKSFFRRASLSNIRYPDCEQTRTCYLNTRLGENLRKCNKCRIQKCFRVGMVQKGRFRRPKTSPNIKKEPDELTDVVEISAVSPGLYKRKLDGTTRSHQIVSQKVIASPNHIFSTAQKFVPKETLVWNLIDQLSYLEVQIDNFRKSAYNPKISLGLEQTIQSPSKLSLAQKYGPMSGWPIKSDQFFKKTIAMRVSNVGQPENVNTNLKDWLEFDLMTSIEYAKTFSFFHQLSFNDKLALVEATTFMNLYLTSAFQSYYQHLDHIRLPDGISNSQILIAITDSLEMGKTVQKQADCILGPMIREKIQTSEYLLLKAVVLCNSAAPELSPYGQEVVELERQKYSSALFHYCLTVYGSQNGPTRFCSILSFSGILERIQKDFREQSLAIAMFIRDKLVPTGMDSAVSRTLQNELLKL